MSGFESWGIKARVAAVLGGLVVLVGTMALVTLLSTLIWPGQATSFARHRCDDAHPDAVVVEHTVQVEDGTSTDLTVYCVSPDGDAINLGWANSFLTLWALYSVVALVLVAGAAVRVVRRRRRRGRLRTTDPEPSPGQRARSTQAQ